MSFRSRFRKLEGVIVALASHKFSGCTQTRPTAKLDERSTMDALGYQRYRSTPRLASIVLRPIVSDRRWFAHGKQR
jgi:hypothetical protein